MYIVIGVLKRYTGRGLGTKLFERLDKWALTHKILRLELTVITQNKRAINLYKKSGFMIEGARKNSLLIEGNPFDEYCM